METMKQVQNIERFHQLRSEKVMVTFHVKKTKNCTHLNEWLSAQTELTNIETAIIDMALERYEQQADGWNEEEFKMNCVGSPIY